MYKHVPRCDCKIRRSDLMDESRDANVCSDGALLRQIKESFAILEKNFRRLHTGAITAIFHNIRNNIYCRAGGRFWFKCNVGKNLSVS